VTQKLLPLAELLYIGMLICPNPYYLDSNTLIENINGPNLAVSSASITNVGDNDLNQLYTIFKARTPYPFAPAITGSCYHLSAQELLPDFG